MTSLYYQFAILMPWYYVMLLYGENQFEMKETLLFTETTLGYILFHDTPGTLKHDLKY
jgi:hypothetical protein